MQSADRWRAERSRILADPEASQALRQFEQALFAGEKPRIEDFPPTIVSPVVASQFGAAGQISVANQPESTVIGMGNEPTPRPDAARRPVLFPG